MTVVRRYIVLRGGIARVHEGRLPESVLTEQECGRARVLDISQPECLLEYTGNGWQVLPPLNSQPGECWILRQASNRGADARDLRKALAFESRRIDDLASVICRGTDYTHGILLVLRDEGWVTISSAKRVGDRIVSWVNKPPGDENDEDAPDCAADH